MHDGRCIGDVALQDMNWRNRTASLGSGIAHEKNRGQGFGNLGLQRITADTYEVNLPSQKALEKAGFVLEGRARKAVYFCGKRYDVLHYGLLVEEWAVG